MTTRAGERLILALDQGTTSSRAIAFGHDGRPVAVAQEPFEQRFPAPGHVTHDPEAIWQTQLAVARRVVAEVGGPERIAAIGIANQRETTIVWDRATGAPVADAIVWQSRITAPACERLRAAGHEPLFRERTGLPLDAYFSGPKITHLLDADPGAGLRQRAERGELAFGTVDSFLLWRLSGGRIHATDVSNASRTLLFDIHRLAWDDELLGLVGVPRPLLPVVRPTAGRFGDTDPSLFGRPIPIAALAGDQQAATFGQACFEPGQAKSTYGTGAFLLLNTGDRPRASANGLLTTVGWQLEPGGPVTYALEGAVFSAGSAVQWLRDGLRAFDDAADVEALAASVPDTDGVYLVPAFTGLGAPHWDPDARGTIVGITRGTTLAHLARATLEAIAFQVGDVLEAMARDGGAPATELRVDGGAAANDFLLQLQADVLGMPVERPVVAETTALGAAYLAGLSVGYWLDLDDVTVNWALDRRYEPAMTSQRRTTLQRGWRRAVRRSLGWAEGAQGGDAR
ncbi:MAG TPA: glycerol kinase GlpK [Candidatus Deferrimicrobiaceae bacterium]|nr:glycerol kinase GlpK [Candidatus Deferrimicrobiaceae bacterium]